MILSDVIEVSYKNLSIMQPSNVSDWKEIKINNVYSVPDASFKSLKIHFPLYHNQARPHTLYDNTSTRCGCSFPSCPGHCMTVHTFVKLARQIMVNNSLIIFPVYWFWATVCSLRWDNRYNCTLPTRTVIINTRQDKAVTHTTIVGWYMAKWPSRQTFLHTRI